LEHGPIGIWAHLKPVLSFVRDQYPAIRHLTFWSDGPSSQYKQKGNFFRLCSDPFSAGSLADMLKSSSFMLVLVCKTISGFPAALRMLFAAYYNLNIAYPSDVAVSMEFRQR